jgi:hypothetical protein
MGKGAKGPDAQARVLDGRLSNGIHAMPHFMRLFSAAHPTALSKLGRDALPRVPWNPSVSVPAQTDRVLGS